MRRTRLPLLLTILVGTIVIGCRSVALPSLYPQGTVQQQQFEAQRFDPLPEPTIGPEVVGARGREYDRPVAEPSRARWDPRTWFSGWQR